MQQLLIATTNQGKFREIKEFLGGLPLDTVSLSDVHIAQEVEEDGTTYEENSQKKAVEYAKLSGLPAISDDGGFEIAALDGAPGIKSKRWLGEHSSEKDIVEKMITLAKTLPENNRSARFVAVETFAMPNGKFWQIRTEVSGIIPMEPKFPLPHGLPYRSFFFIPKLNKYFSDELTTVEMKEYNHRYRAVTKMKDILQEVLHI